ncbi:MAG: DUF4286 family protein [bacterium]|nr:DUF4286 family protein [bacterium]
MIIYTVNVAVQFDLLDNWTQWMRDVHIPDVLKTGLFINATLERVVDPVWEGHTIYVVRYECDSMESYEHYRDEFAPALQADHKERYGIKIVSERTVSEVLFTL